MELVIKGKKHPRLPLLAGCGHLSFLFNQIVGFYDHQFLWKDSSDILVNLHGVSHQREVGDYHS